MDKCDTCFELENIENQCLENKLKLDKHLSEVKEYRDFKKSLIENIDNFVLNLIIVQIRLSLNLITIRVILKGLYTCI